MTCDFTSFSTVFQSYKDDMRMIMKGAVLEIGHGQHICNMCMHNYFQDRKHPELQIRRGNKDDSELIFLNSMKTFVVICLGKMVISQCKHIGISLFREGSQYVCMEKYRKLSLS